MRSTAAELLAKVGLDERVLDLRPSELSGGMQKRVALARAIARAPKCCSSTSRPPASIRSAPT
jgi:phospholipid/cholesterol/gamma-HCH transport system ATP-binding protein